MLEMLELAEVPDVHMDLGHVGIYRGLAKAAGLSDKAVADGARVVIGARAFRGGASEFG